MIPTIKPVCQNVIRLVSADLSLSPPLSRTFVYTLTHAPLAFSVSSIELIYQIKKINGLH